MEILKKKIKLEKVKKNIDGDINIVIDTTKNYNLKFLLKHSPVDLGVFEPVIDENSNYSGETIEYNEYIVTGISESRLSELEKFSISTDLSVKYFTSNTYMIDGLNVSLSTKDVKYVYYLGGITYTDDILNNITTFSFISSGYSDPSFINVPMIKDDKKMGIVDNTIIHNNVFIVRQEISVFENNYRLRNIDNLSDLTNYVGGGYFNIVNNK